MEGLVALYTEGISQKDYILATVQAVNLCLVNSQKKYLVTPQSIDGNFSLISDTVTAVDSNFFFLFFHDDVKLILFLLYDLFCTNAKTHILESWLVHNNPQSFR